MEKYSIAKKLGPKENFEQRFVFTQFLKNGNMVGFGTGKGYEIDLDGSIIFETPDDLNSLHHQITKTEQNTYFLISATIENQYCPYQQNQLLLYSFFLMVSRLCKFLC